MLLLNHTGYQTGHPKKVIFQAPTDAVPGRFTILKQDDKVVFEGTFKEGKRV